MSKLIKTVIINKIDEIISRKKKQKFIWQNSTYEDIKMYLSIDERGDLGEEIIYDVCTKLTNWIVEYDPSVTDNEKGYDIIINNKKIEIKTATITSGSGMFQHEHLEAQRDYDLIIFFDIAPDNVFITIAKKEDIMWRRKKGDDINKTIIHRRPNGDYKCDINISQILNNNIPKLRNFATGEVKHKQDIIDILSKFI